MKSAAPFSYASIAIVLLGCLDRTATAFQQPQSLTWICKSRQGYISLRSVNGEKAADTTSTPRQPSSTTSPPKQHEHTLAILTMPRSSSARIANEAILNKAISVTSKRLSVVLRTNTNDDRIENVSLTRLRRYAGEIYSMAWDAALGLDERDSPPNSSSQNQAGPITSGGQLLDLIVYPQNLPNTPPEGWIANRPDLSCICSHDSITGWVTSDNNAGGSGRKYASRKGRGIGGLTAHVAAVNAERESKGLNPLVGLHVDDWPDGADIVGDPNVVFLEDEDAFQSEAHNMGTEDNESTDGGRVSSSMLGGSSIPPSSLYTSVAVGGTFDGIHYGHRKLLTLAISSVQPINGRLLIGVTKDEMLTQKAFADRIPQLSERIDGVLEFIGNLAPGMKNRIRCIPISDEYGPPGLRPGSDAYPGIKNDFDALVLSHETLRTGRKLNEYRESELGIKPLKLLCTQRTEPHGMSSTALRRMRSVKS